MAVSCAVHLPHFSVFTTDRVGVLRRFRCWRTSHPQRMGQRSLRFKGISHRFGSISVHTPLWDGGYHLGLYRRLQMVSTKPSFHLRFGQHRYTPIRRRWRLGRRKTRSLFRDVHRPSSESGDRCFRNGRSDGSVVSSTFRRRIEPKSPGVFFITRWIGPTESYRRSRFFKSRGDLSMGLGIPPQMTVNDLQSFWGRTEFTEKDFYRKIFSRITNSPPSFSAERDSMRKRNSWWR